MTPDSAPGRYRYDWNEIEPSVAVVEAMSNVSGRDPESLPSLLEILDADALDELCTRSADGPRSVEVSFAYAGHRVTVAGSGQVTVSPLDGGSDTGTAGRDVDASGDFPADDSERIP